MSFKTSTANALQKPESEWEFSSVEERLTAIDPAERILLIPHCLRNSKVCKAESTSEGLNCVNCDPDCQVNRLHNLAQTLGYKGTCIAPGGSLALRYVKETRPAGIVAVACPQELKEGIENVNELAGKKPGSVPPIMVIPLIKEGCVDTEVDMTTAIERISIGCQAQHIKEI